jgi:hypothetical protein
MKTNEKTEAVVMKRLFLLLTVSLIPYFVFADNWEVFRTNKAGYQPRTILQESDIIIIEEGEYLLIVNKEKRQMALIAIPGEKTVWQGIHEAKELEQKRWVAERERLGDKSYLLFTYYPYYFFWSELR